MVFAREFSARGTKHSLSRIFGEAYICTIINYCDSMYQGSAKQMNPDDKDLVSGKDANLTFEQKCHIRDDIYKRARSKAREIVLNDEKYKNASTEDIESAIVRITYSDRMLENVFFESDYGKHYTDFRSAWDVEYEKTFRNSLYSWSQYSRVDEKGKPSRPRYAISPYDPLFSEYFSKVDSFGYIIGDLKPDGTADVDPNTAVLATVNDRNMATNTANSAEISVGEGDVVSVYQIVGAHTEKGEHNNIIPRYSEEFARNINTQGDITPLSDDSAQAGFSIISRFIRDKKEKTAAKDALAEHYKKYGAISYDEYQYIKHACEYLSERGFEFSISVDKEAEGTVSAEVKSDVSKEISLRLLDRKQPKYQGRIYSKGTTLYIQDESSANNNRGVSDCDYNDRLNMLKWYMGENIRVTDPGNRLGTKNLFVGESAYLNTREPVGGYKTMHTTVGSRSATNPMSVMLGDKALPNNDVSNIGIMIKASSTSNAKASSMALFMTDFDIGARTMEYNTRDIRNRIDVSDFVKMIKEHPDDPRYQAYATDFQVTDGEYHIKESVATHPDRVAFYRQLHIRNTLNSWVESAKSEHSKMVDLDNLIEACRNKTADEELNFIFSDDDNIKEVQLLYANAILNNTNDDIESNINSVRQQYADYLEENFGSIPLLSLDGLVKGTGSGFVPESVAKYVQGDFGGNSANANYARITAMLDMMDSYEPWIIKSDSYKSNEIKNSLIRYDDSKVLAAINFGTFFDNEQKRKFAMSAKQFHLTDEQREVALKNINERLKNGKNALDKSTNANDMPLTANMILHVWDTMITSGYDPMSVCIKIDDNGVIQYTGLQYNGNKSGDSKDKAQDKNKYEATMAHIADLTSRSFRGENIDTYLDNAFSASEKSAIENSVRCVRGSIGQIFEPDMNGVIDPKFVVDKDKVIVPGYKAFVVDNDPNNPTDMMDRLRLIGIEQNMRNAIAEEIRRSAFLPAKEYQQGPHGGIINKVYGSTYSTSITKKDYYDNLPKPGETPTAEQETFMNVIKTLRGKCRLPSEYGEGATTLAQSMLDNPHEEEAQRFDYSYSDLVDNENLRVLHDRYKGVFDLNMTGGAKTQGLALYLVDGVKISNDLATLGKVTPSNIETECPLMKDELFKYKYCDSADRRIMAANQLLTALHTPRHVGVAMLNANGWNFDDGFIVSKDFADSNAIMGADGKMRPLAVQDKLSDMHGNKGVISRIVDPNLSTDLLSKAISLGDIDESDVNAVTKVFFSEEAKKSGKYKDYPESFDVKFDFTSSVPYEIQAAQQIQSKLGVRGMDDIMKLFRDNDGTEKIGPDGKPYKSDKLDIIMAPYSGMSRFNGGSIRDMMDNPGNLLINGKLVEGGMGYTNFIVVDMPVDVKTHWYDQEALKEGKGRSASGQFAWALNAKHANHIAGEFYGDNMSSINNLREYSIAIGMDLDKYSAPVIGYHPQMNENRRLITLRTMDEESLGTTYKLKGLSSSDSNEKKSNAKKSSETKVINKKDVDLDKTSNLETDILNELGASGGFLEIPFPLTFKTKDYLGKFDKSSDLFVSAKTGRTFDVTNGEKTETIETYGIPVLSHKLRSGQEFLDGTLCPHDYTKSYVDIYTCATTYLACRKAILDEKDPNNIATLNSLMNDLVAEAQSEFDKITSDIIERKFDSKHNLIRESLTKNPVKASATAVWSATSVDQQGVRKTFDADACRARGMSDDYIEHMRQQCAITRADGCADDKSSKFDYYDYSMGLDKIAISTENAKQLGLLDENNKLKPDVALLVWRDPILSDGGVRCLTPTIDDSIIGVAVNPLIDKSFDGDFDGDSVGLGVVSTRKAVMEAKSKFGLGTNLVNKGETNAVDPSDYDGLLFDSTRTDGKVLIHSLYIQDGLDVASNSYNNAFFNEERKRLTILANNIAFVERKIAAGELDANSVSFKDGVPNFGTGSYTRAPEGEKGRLYGMKALDAMRRQCVDDLNMWSKGVLSGIGTDHIIVKDAKTVVESCQHIVDDGAKGSQSKMKNLTDNMGIIYDTDENGRPVMDSITELKDDNGKHCSCSTKNGTQRADDVAIQITTAYKADNTQLGGKIAQDAVAATREIDAIWDALQATYPVTQAILQSKHDPADARSKDKIVRFWGSDVWRGYKLEGDFTGSAEDIQNSPHPKKIVTFVDSKGNEQQTYQKCTSEEWKVQMRGMFRALKLDNVADDVIDRLADAMINNDTSAAITTISGRTVKAAVDPNKGKIAGLDDMAEHAGALIDKVGYGSGKFDAYLQAGLKNTRVYNQSNFDPSKLESIYGSAAELAKHQGFDRGQLSNSQVFVPNSFINGHKRGFEKPIGRADVLLNNEEIAAGDVAVMRGDMLRSEEALTVEARSQEGMLPCIDAKTSNVDRSKTQFAENMTKKTAELEDDKVTSKKF